MYDYPWLGQGRHKHKEIIMNLHKELTDLECRLDNHFLALEELHDKAPIEQLHPKYLLKFREAQELMPDYIDEHEEHRMNGREALSNVVALLAEAMDEDAENSGDRYDDRDRDSLNVAGKIVFRIEKDECYLVDKDIKKGDNGEHHK